MRSAMRVLLVAVAVGALPVLATDAAAQSVPLSAHEEATTNVCDPCTFEAAGESRLIALPSGVAVGNCTDQYTGTIYGDGSGEMQWTGTTEGSPGCVVANCLDGEANWPISDAAIVASGTFDATVRMCVRSGSTEVHCNAHAQISLTNEIHGYDYEINQLCLNSSRQVEATGYLEAINGIEITELE